MQMIFRQYFNRSIAGITPPSNDALGFSSQLSHLP